MALVRPINVSDSWAVRSFRSPGETAEYALAMTCCTHGCRVSVPAMKISGLIPVAILGLINAGCGAAAEDFAYEDDPAYEMGPVYESESEEEIGQVQQPIFGSDACKDARIRIHNLSGQKIKIKGVKYYDTSHGWRNEGLADRWLDDGYYITYTETLEYTRNDRITAWKLYYEHDVIYAATNVDRVESAETWNTKCISKEGTLYKLYLY